MFEYDIIFFKYVKVNVEYRCLKNPSSREDARMHSNSTNTKHIIITKKTSLYNKKK